MPFQAPNIHAGEYIGQGMQTLASAFASMLQDRAQANRDDDMANGTLWALAHDPAAPSPGGPAEGPDHGTGEGAVSAPAAPDYTALAKAGGHAEGLLKLAGVDPALLKTKSAGWKMGMLKGLGLRQSFQEMTARLADMEAQRQERAALAAARTAATARQSRLDQEQDATNADVTGFAQAFGDMGPEQALAMFPRAALHPQVDNLVTALSRNIGKQEANEWKFDPSKHVVPLGKDFPGRSYVQTSTHSGQVVSQAGTDGQLVPQFDETGQIKGYALPNAKGGLTQWRESAAPKVDAATQARQELQDQLRATYTDVHTQLRKLQASGVPFAKIETTERGATVARPVSKGASWMTFGEKPVSELIAEYEALLAGQPAKPSAPVSRAPAPAFNTSFKGTNGATLVTPEAYAAPEDVRKAWAAGGLTEDQAVEILKTKFGMK